MKLFPLALAALLLAPATAITPGTAHAHQAEALHGGQMVDAPPYHLELVAKGRDITLYVLDSAMKPVDTTGAQARATILAGGKPELVPLAPAGTNILRGAAGVDLGQDAKVVTSLTLPGQKPVQARFNIDGHAP
ncbi:MAG: hypothetical protein RLY86_820 [Pseudomonadota bacterium]|jgi:hypothetical protein